MTTVAIASQRNTNSVFCIMLLGTFSLLSSTQIKSANVPMEDMIPLVLRSLVEDLWSESTCLAGLWANNTSVALFACYGACNSFFAKSSVLVGSYMKVNVFTGEVVFRLNITCKTIFILYFKDFLKLSLGINVKTFERVKKIKSVRVIIWIFNTRYGN